MNLYIKNMVSHSCILLVKAELNKLDIPFTAVNLGEIRIDGTVDLSSYQQFVEAMQEIGFEVLQCKKKILVERIKNIVVESVHHTEDKLKFRFSDYICSKLNYNYKYLSNLFSEEQGITIEKYMIAQRIERVKELMAYEELNLNEIAFRVHYSSASHLSKQFKKITGISPSDYKKLTDKVLTPLEQVGIAV
jgi:YesN/AraC family two-component response regulator